MGSYSRRDVLRLGAVTLLGALVPEPLLRTLGAAPPPWDVLPGIPPDGSGPLRADTPMILGSGKRNEYPAVAASEGKTWAAWVTSDGNVERLVLRQVLPAAESSNDERSLPLTRCHRPALAVAGDRVYVAWAGTAPAPQDMSPHDSNMTIGFAQLESDGRLQVLGTLGSGKWLGNPALAVDVTGTGFLAWESLESNGHFATWVAPIRRGKIAQASAVASPPRGDARRPALALLDESTAWVVWDESTDGDVAIKARLVRANAALGNVVAVTSGRGLHLAPAAACDRQGHTWLAWYTNCWPDGTTDIPRRVEIAVLDRSGRVSWPPQPDIVARETTSTVQGLEFPQLACSPDGRVWLSARASQNFFLIVFDGNQWSAPTRLHKDGWGGRGQHVALAPIAKGEIMTARRDLDDAVVQKFTVSQPLPAHSPRLSPKGRTPVASARVREKIDFEPWGEWHFYFGDIHGHTSLSDGTGDVDEFYLMRRDVYAEDFAALTDHDSFVGNTLSPSEWEEIKAITEHFNEPGRFVTLFGQEWTTLRVPRGSGHMNVYSCRRDIPLFDHTLPEYATADKLVEAARKYEAIAIPHHIGWTGTRWEAFAPDVVPLVEIVSVHGAHEFMGNRPLAHRGGLPGYFAQDGLARGLRFGFIGGTDCHGLLWQHGECWKRDPYLGGLACVLAPQLTREAVFEALRKRRCYATSGIRARIVFEANGSPMGADIDAAEKLEFKVAVSSESLLRWIEIVKDNATVYCFGGEGHQSQFTWSDPEWSKQPPGKTSYYYLRVTCRDDNMAWSSPIWVRRRA